MENRRDKVHEYLRSEEQAKIQAREADERRRKEQEEELIRLWQALEVHRKLREIKDQVWNGKGEVIVNDKGDVILEGRSAALVFRYQSPLDTRVEPITERRVGWHKEPKYEWGPLYPMDSIGPSAGWIKVGERSVHGPYEVVTGHKKYYKMIENTRRLLEVSLKWGHSEYKLSVHPEPSQLIRSGGLIIKRGSVDLERARTFLDQALTEDCVNRSRNHFLPSDLEQGARAREADFRARGYIRES